MPPDTLVVNDRSCPGYVVKSVFGNLLYDKSVKNEFNLKKNSESRKVSRPTKIDDQENKKKRKKGKSSKKVPSKKSS